MKLVQRAAVLLLALGLLGLGGNGDVTSTGSFEPSTGPRVAAHVTAFPDTIRTTAAPNTPLLLPLPTELQGEPVERYTLLHGQALSGVAGRSFTWIPEGASPDIYEARLQAHGPDAAPPDTLVLRIDLSS